MASKPRKRRWEYPKGSGQWKEAWVFNYTLNGKRRQVTCTSKKEADRERLKVETEIEAGVHTPARETLSVEEAIEEFLRESDRLLRLGDISKATVKNRTGNAKIIPPWLRSLLVTELTTEHAQRMIDDLREKYAPWTVHNIYNLLSGTMGLCLKRKWVKRNILRDVPPKLPKASQRAKIPSDEDVFALLQAVFDLAGNGDLLTLVNRACGFSLAIGGALRPGEIFGLHWEDVDYQAGVIHIRHSHTYINGLRGPKTEAGIRDIHLNDLIFNGLDHVARYWAARVLAADDSANQARMHLRTNKNFHAGLGDRKELTGIVILNRWGNPMASGKMADFFSGPMESAGLLDADSKPKFTMHALRHYSISKYLQQLPLTHVKELAGHASVKTTSDVYGHVLKGDKRIAETSKALGEELLNATRMRQRLLTN